MQAQTEERSERAETHDGRDAVRALCRSRLGELFALTGKLTTKTLHDLEADVLWRTLEGGATLFHEGDEASSAYVLVSGRLRETAMSADRGERVLHEIGPGEPVGEMALLTGGRRTATVYAVRDSHVAEIPRRAFERLVDAHPKALLGISRVLAERLERRGDDGEPAADPAPATLALVPASPGVALDGFARELTEALSAHGSVRLLTGPEVLAEHPAGAGDAHLVEHLNRLEEQYRFVVYQADAEPTAWSDRAVRQADHVLIVADAQAEATPGELERRLTDRPRRPRLDLVLLQDGRPAGTSRWLDARDVEAWYHVQPGQVGDFARLARFLTGTAVGLVLGGGGARGGGHVGVLKAVEELGLPIDAVGGTSMGSILAGLHALGHDAATVLGICSRGFQSLLDYTFPIVSLLRGRRIYDECYAAFGDLEIEDLPIPFFAVSTNLTRAEPFVHRRGRLLDALRASMALPGVLPPVERNGDLLVDGGILSNVPADVMRELCGRGLVIASDVGQEVEVSIDPRPDVEESGFKHLWNRLNPWAERIRTPGILSLLQRASDVGGLALRQRTRSLADVYLELPLGEWGLLEFEAVEAIAARGYEVALAPLTAWREAANVRPLLQSGAEKASLGPALMEINEWVQETRRPPQKATSPSSSSRFGKAIEALWTSFSRWFTKSSAASPVDSCTAGVPATP